MIVADVEVYASFAKTQKPNVASEKEFLPLGACGLKVRFHFRDPAWERLSKTAVFRNGSVTVDAVIHDSCAEIPHEVLTKVKDTVCVGVYGTDSSRNLAIPTLWANLGTVGSAANPSGESSAEPTLPYWAQLKEQMDVLQVEKLDREDLDQALLQAKESGDFDGPAGPRGEKGDPGEKGDSGEPGKDGANSNAGKSAYEYAKEAGYTDSESMFGHDLVAAMRSDALIGTAETAFGDYYRAIQAEKVVLLYHEIYYQVSGCDINRVEFVGVDGEGMIRHAVVTSNDAWTFDTVGGAVFVGDENTTVAEYHEASRAGKVCFMRRPQGGSGITNWVAFLCSSTNAFFYHVNSTGRLEYGCLTSDGQWDYTSIEVGTDGGTSVQPDWNAAEGEPGYVLNRTHFVDPMGQVLAESNATTYTHPTFGKTWLIEKGISMKVGNTYTVIYQGISYHCVCQAAPSGFSDDPNAVALGNFGLVMPNSNTGEPFVMLISKEFGRIDILDATNVGAVCVEILGEVVHKIDAAFLPNDTPKLFNVIVSVDSAGNAIADKTFEEIAEKTRDSNVIVRAVVKMAAFGDAIFLPLVFVTLEGAIFGIQLFDGDEQPFWMTVRVNSDDTARFFFGNT